MQKQRLTAKLRSASYFQCQKSVSSDGMVFIRAVDEANWMNRLCLVLLNMSIATRQERHSTQLINGDGLINDIGVERFIKELKVVECKFSYAVVAMIGPYISGKSTLLNHLFYTNFREMDAFNRRFQTTKRIWMANCPGKEH